MVGAGLRAKSDFRRPLASLIPPYISHIPENVQSFTPVSSSVTTVSGRELSYDVLVVATGLKINWNAVTGLPEALTDPSSGVSSIYSYETCDKVWSDVEALRSGQAIFTQPQGVIKCAGGKYIYTIHHRCPTRPPRDFKQPHKKSCGWRGTDIDGQGAATTFKSTFILACRLCSP